LTSPGAGLSLFAEPGWRGLPVPMRWCLRDLSIRYLLDDGGAIDALTGVSLVIEQGERLAIVGANGSGKSTLARCLAGLLEPTQGQFTVESDPVPVGNSRSDADSMAAFVFQAPEDNLIAETVREEIMLTLEHSGAIESEQGLLKKILTDSGLDHLADRQVQRLSGGEKQKLAIACALASGRDLIVLDEPTSHLDPPGRSDLLSLVLDLRHRDDTIGGDPAVILITQYEEDARLFPRMVALEGGRIVFDGPPDRWQGQLSRRGHSGFNPAPPPPDSPAIVAARRLSQVAQAGWPLPPQPLADITAEVRAGDAIALCGPIGSGKSTLGYHLAGLIDSYTGRLDMIWVHRPQESPAVMIQFPERQLFCATVGEDVAFGPSARGRTRSRASELATAALATMGLSPSEFMNRSPFDLSAGQQRRVGMAGVVACAAPFYILDEPTAALDSDGLSRLEELLASWHRSGATYLIISHDLEWLAAVTSRVWVMDAGRLLFDGLWSDSARLEPVLASIRFRRD